MSYLTVARSTTHEEVVKGSRFIAYVTHVATVAEAMATLERTRATYPDATHHCWAYRLGGSYRFSDDGEPGGTAGRPMLEVLTRRGLEGVMAVVTRYYGGTKLGAGGLVRAYGGSLAKALDLAGIEEVKARVGVSVVVPFTEMDRVHRLLDGWPELEKGEVGYGEAGMVLQLTLLEDDREAFKREVADLTRGAARVLDEQG